MNKNHCKKKNKYDNIALELYRPKTIFIKYIDIKSKSKKGGKGKMRRNKGITLIALVITIIVLLILAGVAIAMLSGENGILKKAAEAKTKTDKSSEEEQVRLAALSALAADSGNIGTEKYYEALNKELNKIKAGIGTVSGLPAEVKIGDNRYVIRKNGEASQLGEAGWMYKKDSKGRETIVTNGIYDLPIGTYINYNAAATDAKGETVVEKKITSNAGSPTDTGTSGYYKASEKTVTEGNGYGPQEYSNKATTNGWRILGVDEKTGELLIISADPVKTTGNANFYLRGIAGYNYGESELNKVCSVFGSGYGATGARSVNVDDINKITGYNPNNVGKYDPEQKTTETKYGKDGPNEYGNKTTYSWTSTANQVSWSGSNTKSGKGSNPNYATYGFNWYDIGSKTWKNSMQDTTTPATIATLTSTSYYYYPDSLKTSSGAGEGLSTTSEEYKTLFMNKAGSKVSYWLASSCVGTGSNYAAFGLRSVSFDGYVRSHYLFNSYGRVYSPSLGVRPVVSLKSDIQLGEGTKGSYDIK